MFFENLQFYLFTYLGSNMGASWRHLWAILAAIRAIFGRLGAIWEALRINLGSLEAGCVRLKDFRSHFRLILQYLGAIFGPFADVLGSHCNFSLSFRSSVVSIYVFINCFLWFLICCNCFILFVLLFVILLCFCCFVLYLFLCFVFHVLCFPFLHIVCIISFSFCLFYIICITLLCYNWQLLNCNARHAVPFQVFELHLLHCCMLSWSVLLWRLTG